MAKKPKRELEDSPPSDELAQAEMSMADDGGPPAPEAGSAQMPAPGIEAPEEADWAAPETGSGRTDADWAAPEAASAEAPTDWVGLRGAPESDSGRPAAGAPQPVGVGPIGLAAELERARAERQEFLDGWQRARAEFANYRKRMERDQEEARSRIAGEILLRVLAIMDDLNRALKDRPADGEFAAWADGIELIYRKFQALLEAEGVEVIQAEDQAFDPALHEALSHEESEAHQEGQVIEVVQRGYRIGERVLRPALVRVAK